MFVLGLQQIFGKIWDADLCVLGRETSFSESREIRFEIFIHGAICINLSRKVLNVCIYGFAQMGEYKGPDCS